MTTEERLVKEYAFSQWLKSLCANPRWASLSDEEEQQRVVAFIKSGLFEVVKTLPEWETVESAFDVTDSSRWDAAQNLLLSNAGLLDESILGQSLKSMKLMDLFCQEQERLLRQKNRRKQRKSQQKAQNKQDSLLPPTSQQEEAEMEEGALRQVSVTTRERSKEARQACLRKYGRDAYVCQACGFDFEKFYGPEGKEYIEVHHLNPLAATYGQHTIDPAEGLVPLCSNCHSMIHRAGTDILHPISLEQLKDLIRRQHNKEVSDTPTD